MFLSIVLFFFQTTLCHLVLNIPQVWGIEDSVSLEYPIDNTNTNPICSGRSPNNDPPNPEDIVNIVAGNTYSYQIICGELELDAPGCLVGDWHAGDDVNDFSGCGLSVSYNDHTNLSDHKYISYSPNCARRGQDTLFRIAQDIQNCELCVCSWSWAPSRMYSSPGQFYSNCFYCSITNGIGSESYMKNFDFINIQGGQHEDITYNDLNPRDIYDIPSSSQDNCRLSLRDSILDNL